MEGSLKFLSIILIAGCLHITSGQKSWVPNTDFDNPSNWGLGRVPCSRDTVVFDANTPLLVSLRSKSPLKELILPLNGEFLLSNGESLDFGEDPSETCEGQENNFKTLKFEDWYSPLNWLSDVDKKRQSYRSPVPEAFMVPCMNDIVTFPEESSYKVNLEGPTVRIGRLQIAGKVLDAQSFNDYLETPEGQLQFKKSTDVKILSAGCQDPKGCACGNDDPEYQFYICENVGDSCPATDCSDPIKPAGSCCEFCGSYMVVVPGDTFQYNKLTEVVDSSKNLSDYDTVKTNVVKLSDGNIQITTVDVNENHQVAGKFSNLLKNKITQDSSIGASKIEIHSSGGYVDPSAGLSGGIIALIVILVLLAISLVIFGFVKKCHHRIPFGDTSLASIRNIIPSTSAPSLTTLRSRMQKKFQKSTEDEEGDSYARFDVLKGAVSLPEETGRDLQLFPSSVLNSQGDVPPEALGFDNPMFMRPISKKDPPAPKDLPSKVAVVKSSVGWTNPMYEKMDSPTDEPQHEGPPDPQEDPKKPDLISKVKTEVGLKANYSKMEEETECSEGDSHLERDKDDNEK